MAKLKIPKNVAPSSAHPDGFDHSTPNEQGYVNVVENLILDDVKYKEFLGLPKKSEPRNCKMLLAKMRTV